MANNQSFKTPHIFAPMSVMPHGGGGASSLLAHDFAFVSEQNDVRQLPVRYHKNAGPKLPKQYHSLPRPAEDILELQRRGYVSDGIFLSSRSLVDCVKVVAVHEAAHAVVHSECGIEVELVTLIPRGGLDGWCGYRFSPHDDTRKYVCGNLAGPVVDTLSGVAPIVDAADIAAALTHLGCNRSQKTLCEAWKQTVMLMTTPLIWRSVMTVAADLLRHGSLSGTQVQSTMASTPEREVPGVSAMRDRVLALGNTPLRSHLSGLPELEPKAGDCSASRSIGAVARPI